MNRKVKFIFAGLFIAAAVLFLAPFASKYPDGLEKTVPGGHNILMPIIPEYLFPGIHNEKLATIAAGLLGVITVFAFSYLLARILKMKDK